MTRPDDRRDDGGLRRDRRRFWRSLAFFLVALAAFLALAVVGLYH